VNTNLNSKIYNADIYLRLSKEDGDKEESDSITNQKELILAFLEDRKDIRVHAVRVDDGYSGVSFKRPAFQQMIEDIRSGEVNCVVTKDLSRFGRDHIEVGKYIEKIFPYLGVRFIAINDHYDSMEGDAQANNILVPFKNLINDAYCRDISIKTRSNLEAKRRRGDFVGAFAPYGYQKSASDKNKLEIDWESAEIVRQIYRWYLQGHSAYRIAEMLNRQDVLTPMDYKRMNGSAYYTGFKKNLKGEWNHVHILRILSNPVYMGTLIQGKNTTPNYKVKKKIQRDQSQWSIVEHVHEAIIPASEYNTVQEVLRADTRTASAGDGLYSLSGIAKCGDCGANMVRKTVPCKGRKYVYYVCGGHKERKQKCSMHSIRADMLEETVLKLLNRQIACVLDLEETLSRMEEIRSAEGAFSAAEIARRSTQFKRKKEEIQKYSSLRVDLYEDYKEGLISGEEYQELKAAYERRVADAQKAMDVLQEELEILLANQGHSCEWVNEFRKYGHLESLTREIAVSLIDKISVYEKKKGERMPRIEVRFKYAEQFHVYMTLVEDLRKELPTPEEEGGLEWPE